MFFNFSLQISPLKISTYYVEIKEERIYQETRSFIYNMYGLHIFENFIFQQNK